MKLNQATTKIITDATAVGLEAAINVFLKAGGEKQLVSIQFTQAATINSTNVRADTFTAYIIYTS